MMDRKDNKDFARIKDDAKKVRDCFEANVAQYLVKFPTESDLKFNYRKSPHISKFTNFVAGTINAMAGIALKKYPKVDDDELKDIPKQVGNALINIGCDAVGYLFVDAPKLEKDNQKENVASITYIEPNRVIGEPEKDTNGNIIYFVFEGEEEYLDDNDNVKTRKYRKVIFNGGGEKYVEVGNKFDIVDTWIYSFDGVPVIELDIRTANKHPYIDIAENNLWYYNLESDERNIIHLICSPYVQFFGEVKEDKKQGETPAQVFIGADRARRFNDKTTEGIVITEASGSGVQHATNKLQQSAEMITRMSVSVLSNTNYKTATQAEDSQSKSLGFMPFIVMTVEHAFNRAIEFMGKFRGREYQGGVTLSKKFSVAEYNAAQLGYIRDLYDRGVITKSTTCY